MRAPNSIIAACLAAVLASPLAAQDGAAVRRQVEALGTGAEVKVRFADGRRERGVIRETRSEDFEILAAKKGAAKSFAYTGVASVEFAKRAYRSKRGRDPVAARRVAETLGTGHHVLARVRTGKTYRGHIGTIGREELTLLQDHARGPVTIAYAEMDHLEQNLSLKAKIAIAAAIGGGIAFLIYFRTVIDHDE